MPSKTDTTKGVPTQKDFDDLDNYFDDLDDDPFASPKPAEKSKESSNKRKEPGDGLGIDEEIAVAKKARVPRIKLDEERYVDIKPGLTTLTDDEPGYCQTREFLNYENGQENSI